MSSVAFTVQDCEAARMLPVRLPLRRVLAVDAFRGLTILVMIFVNALGGVSGMPAWLYHAPGNVNGMTVPDVVFPAFLFIAGMSIPFATAQRLAAGGTSWTIAQHVLARTLGLLVLGVFMVNAEEGYNEKAMGLSVSAWSLLFIACAILVWGVYRFRNRWIAALLRLTGIGGLIALAVMFRGGEDGAGHIEPQWWGILGLIGWAYLYSSAIYLLARGGIAPLAAALSGCVIYYCFGQLDAVQSSETLSMLAGQTDHAVNTSIALCGVMTTLIFFKGSGDGSPPRFGAALFLALALIIAGTLLEPLYGISKSNATPSWALYSAAICVALFAMLYWLIDLRGTRAWTVLLRPAAANPLLAFLIPGIVFSAMQLLHLKLPAPLLQGAPGLAGSIVFAFAVLALTAGLNRLNVRLQL